MEAEQNEEVASKVEEVKGEASVSAQVQDPLEEVNLGEGSAQQPTYISAWLSPINRNQLLIANVTYIPRVMNHKANDVAQKASNFKRNGNTQVDISQATYQKLIPPLAKMGIIVEGADGLLLECLGPQEAFTDMVEVYESICGAHQPDVKIRWLLRRHSYYWPIILKDCIEYAKECQACQKHDMIRHVPITDLYTVVKPWPFRG
ncbi:uncharacterized protein LOC114264819 [Camellia sinensis]|uniref:uncharacterized protein LOC114264819 n=1 Tax=Camellia sinensis TaxID=4442 RepID=UPI00103679F3|nr:uncharacterized protein LOC114264819 [Camellia sinensis]